MYIIYFFNLGPHIWFRFFKLGLNSLRGLTFEIENPLKSRNNQHANQCTITIWFDINSFKIFTTRVKCVPDLVKVSQKMRVPGSGSGRPSGDRYQGRGGWENPKVEDRAIASRSSSSCELMLDFVRCANRWSNFGVMTDDYRRINNGCSTDCSFSRFLWGLKLLHDIWKGMFFNELGLVFKE